MINITVTVEGLNATVGVMKKYLISIPEAIDSGLGRIAEGVAKKARRLTSGSKTAPPGSYPVPVRTGKLKGSIDWLRPEQEAYGGIRTGKHEAMVFCYPDAAGAPYAQFVHEGQGTSTKYGRRPFLADAFKEFNSGGAIVDIMAKEIQRGLGERA